MRIAINGFGRIGRSITRALQERSWPHQLVAINDLQPPKQLAHLLQYDSLHGRLNCSVESDQSHMIIDQQVVETLSQPLVDNLPWQQLAVDLVLECSGRLVSREALQKHLNVGAKRVLLSAPLKDADRTVVYGVNHQQIEPRDQIISNSSCTTNCLAPVVQVLHNRFGLEQGILTTIHAYTADQQLVDCPSSDPYRARAAALSMIPTKTGAAQAIGLVVPELAGKLSGMAVRVPTANVSLIDLHCCLKKSVSVAAINQAMEEAANGYLSEVMNYTDLPLVSVDFCHQAASCVFDANHTQVIAPQIKVMAWYDNEWGFANRMLDVSDYLSRI